MGTILIIVVLILLLGGGGGYVRIPPVWWGRPGRRSRVDTDRSSRTLVLRRSAYQRLI